MLKIILISIHFALFPTIESVYNVFSLDFLRKLDQETSEIDRNLYKNWLNKPKMCEIGIDKKIQRDKDRDIIKNIFVPKKKKY